MARISGLTPIKVQRLTDEGFHRDYGAGAATGLFVQVSWRRRDGVRAPEHGVTRSWVYRFVSPVTGKPRWMGLGPCDAIGLADARDLARAARRLVKLGADPIEHRGAAVKAERDAALKATASPDDVRRVRRRLSGGTPVDLPQCEAPGAMALEPRAGQCGFRQAQYRRDRHAGDRQVPSAQSGPAPQRPARACAAASKRCSIGRRRAASAMAKTRRVGRATFNTCSRLVRRRSTMRPCRSPNCRHS